jgi:hypothetical protein
VALVLVSYQDIAFDLKNAARPVEAALRHRVFTGSIGISVAAQLRGGRIWRHHIPQDGRKYRPLRLGARRTQFFGSTEGI